MTNNLPTGYSIHKWKYNDRGNKHNAHAIYLTDKPVFNQNKVFESLTDARKAVKLHVDTERLKKQVKKEMEYFKKHGNLGKTGYLK